MTRTPEPRIAGWKNVLFAGIAVALVAPAGAVQAPAHAGIDLSDPASALATLPPGTPAATVDALHAALARGDEARALGEAMRDATTLSARFRVAAGLQGVRLDEPTAAPAYASLQDALTDLATGAGVPLDDALRAQIAEASLPPTLEAPVLDLVGAAVQAQRLRAAAFADVGDEDMAYLQEAVAQPERWTEARFLEVASRVDRRALDEAAHVMLAAIDHNVPALQEAAALVLPPILGADPGCAPLLGPGILVISRLLAIGGPGPEGYGLDYVLSVDLGGNDVYCNNAGGTFSGVTPFTFFLPVAAALDVAGNDKYNPPLAAPALKSQIFGVEGAGVLGVGLLVDFTGNDDYHSGFTACTNPLPAPGLPGYAVVASQGSGLVGVGVLADLGAAGGAVANRYNSGNRPLQCSFAVHDSQGSGYWGLGLLLDVAAGSFQSEFNTGNTVNQTYLVDHSQGAGTFGVGVLVGIDGNDKFNHDNVGPLTYEVLCSQGAGGFCGHAPRIPHPAAVTVPPLPGGLGVLLKLAGNDCYNCYNKQFQQYTVNVAQGAAGGAVVGPVPILPPNSLCFPVFAACLGGVTLKGAADAGLLLEWGGANEFNTRNFVNNYVVNVAQGAADGHPRLGVFVSLSNGDELNANNGVATMTIDLVQGAASGGGSLGALLEISTAQNKYNSKNNEGGGATIMRMQGFGDQASVGAMIDIEPAGGLYNADNTAGAVTITDGLGRANSVGGVGAFLDVAGTDSYNTGNTGGLTLTNVHGVAPLGAALFADVLPLAAPGDAYTALTAGTACTGIFAAAIDLLDGLDAAGLWATGVGLPAVCVDQ